MRLGARPIVAALVAFAGIAALLCPCPDLADSAHACCQEDGPVLRSAKPDCCAALPQMQRATLASSASAPVAAIGPFESGVVVDRDVAPASAVLVPLFLHTAPPILRI